jgi:putative SOS response-associated peptidase YedK
MWNSIKGRKRCVIPVMGYYEWLKKGKDKVPHFTKRADGKIMLLAGLWDSVRYEGIIRQLPVADLRNGRDTLHIYYYYH